MRALGSPFDMLHRVMASAAMKDLPDQLFYRRDHQVVRTLTAEQRAECTCKEAEFGLAAWPGLWKPQRPDFADISVQAMFPQMWGSSSLGFSGLGAAAMTTAYTVVLKGPAGDQSVYFGGQFAYLVPASRTDQSGQFMQDLLSQALVDVRQAEARYGAIPHGSATPAPAYPEVAPHLEGRPS